MEVLTTMEQYFDYGVESPFHLCLVRTQNKLNVVTNVVKCRQTVDS